MLNAAQTWAMLGILTAMLWVITTLTVAFMRKGFDEMKGRFDTLDVVFTSRLDALQQVTEVRFTAVDQRLDRVEICLDRVETRLDSIDRDVQVVSIRLAEMRADEPPT